MALPTTRLTGHLNLTNSSPDFHLTNGVAIKQYRYPVKGIWYTNIYPATVTFTEQVEPDGSVVVNYESETESSPIPPFEFALGEDVYNSSGLEVEDLYSTATTALLSQYRDYLIGTGQIEGVEIFAGSGGPSDQDLINRLSHEDWSVTFPGLAEHQVHDVLHSFSTGWGALTDDFLDVADETLMLSGVVWTRTRTSSLGYSRNPSLTAPRRIAAMPSRGSKSSSHPHCRSNCSPRASWERISNSFS